MKQVSELTRDVQYLSDGSIRHRKAAGDALAVGMRFKSTRGHELPPFGCP